MYTNLIAKMEEKKISKRDIQKLLDIHYNWIYITTVFQTNFLTKPASRLIRR